MLRNPVSLFEALWKTVRNVLTSSCVLFCLLKQAYFVLPVYTKSCYRVFKGVNVYLILQFRPLIRMITCHIIGKQGV